MVQANIALVVAKKAFIPELPTRPPKLNLAAGSFALPAVSMPTEITWLAAISHERCFMEI